MAASKAKVIEQLAKVKNLGSAYATRAYEDLKVRSLEDLIEAAKSEKLQTIKGIGPAKEKAILAAAQELAKGVDAPAPPAKPKTPSKPKAKKDAPKKDAPKKAAPKKDAPKKDAPKKDDKPAASKPEPKKDAPKPAAKAAERPRTTYRPPQPKPRPSIPGLIFKITKKIIGRILG